MTTSGQLDPAEHPTESAGHAEPKPALGETQSHVGNTASGVAQGNVAAAEGPTAGPGPRLGKYEIRHLLGSGGMGVVYRAHDTLIERDVAIKVLPHEVSSDPVTLQRFLAEAKAAGKLSNSHTVAIYEVGQEGSTYYLVMEFVSGGSVADELKQNGPIAPLEATRIAADACRGLAAAHAVGLVHRDMKPANLLRAENGTIKVADFGLAKPSHSQTHQLTQTGQVIGTPYFMSPEQCESRPVDHRSDLYSLGATYYTMLTGADPYQDAGSIVQVMYAHCTGDVLDPRQRNPSLPAGCSQIVARATAKRPEDRYQSAGEMLADLETLSATLSGDQPSGRLIAATQPAWRARRRRYLAATAVGIAALLVALGALWSSRNGGSADDAKSAPLVAAVPTVVAAPSGPPIRVGVLHSLSGTMSESESPVVEATLLAIDELNAAGGVLGRKVEPLVRDGRSDPHVFLEQAEKLIADDKVCTVFGCWTSASRRTVEPAFERNDNLLVYPVQYEGLDQSPNVVYLGATPNQQIIPAIEWAFAFQGKRRFFIVGSDYIFPRAASAVMRDVLTKLGAELVGEEFLPLGSYDVKPVVAKIREATPEVILNLINGDSNVPFFKELRTEGITPARVKTISFSIGEAEIRQLRTSEMVGDFAAWNYFESIDSEANRQFVSRFKAKYGPQRVLSDPMEAAYIGVKLWAQAVEQAGNISPANIRAAMSDQKIAAPEGPVRIDPATHNAFKTPRVGQIGENGQFEIVWQAVKPEAPAPYPPTRSPQEWNALVEDLYRGWGNHWSAPSD